MVSKGEGMRIEEFYLKCDSIEPDEYGCKIWPTVSTWLKSQVWINGQGHRTVSRLALERKLGHKLKFWALHTCDSPSCINPNHLYEGTPKDNQQDRKQRNPESYEYLKSKKQRELIRQAYRRS
jgi:hypothetical protein